MQKGQSSVDMLLAILVALVFFAVLNVHNDNLKTQVDEISVKNGLKSVLLDAYSATGSAKAYGLTIDYVSPKLKIGQSAKPLNCIIRFKANGSGGYDLNVVSGNMGASYTEIKLDDIKLNGTALAETREFACGEKFTIEKA